MGISSCKAINDVQQQHHVIITTSEQTIGIKNVEQASLNATSPSYRIPEQKSNDISKPQILSGPIVNQDDEGDIWVPSQSQQLYDREGPSNKQQMPLKFEQGLLVSMDQFNNRFYEKDFCISSEREADFTQQNQQTKRTNYQLDQAFIKRFKSDYENYLKQLQTQVKKDKEKILQGNKNEDRRRAISQMENSNSNKKVKSREKGKKQQQNQVKQQRHSYNYIYDKPFQKNEFQFEQEQINFANTKLRDFSPKREIQSILKPRGRSSTRSLDKCVRRVSFKIEDGNRFSKNNYAQFIHKMNMNKQDFPHHYYSNLEIF